jgi:hypothetical protein
MPAGTYVLSWSGTATGRVYNSGATPPSYAASPVTVTLDGLANVVVEFTASGSTKTLGTVQLEGGTVFSPFEYRHRGEELALCQRYYMRFFPETTGSSAWIGNGFAFLSTNALFQLPFPVTMRVAPTSIDVATLRMTDLNNVYTIFVASIASDRTSRFALALACTSSGMTVYRPLTLEALFTGSGFLGASAEL